MKKTLAIWSLLISLAAIAITGYFLKRKNGESTDSGELAKIRKLKNEAAQNTNYLQFRYANFGLTKIPQATTKLLDSLRINNCLVYRFTQLNCNLCIESEIVKLKKLAENIGKDKIALLISFSTNKEVKIITHKYNLDLPVYNVDLAVLKNLPIEELNVPYCYLVKGGSVSMVFIPDKALPELSYSYYNKIKMILKAG